MRGTFVTYDLLFPDQKNLQELIKKPWDLYARHATNRFDHEYGKLIREGKQQLNDDINQPFVKMWETYAKRSLKMNAAVIRFQADAQPQRRLQGRGKSDLIARENTSTEDATIAVTFSILAAYRYSIKPLQL